MSEQEREFGKWGKPDQGDVEAHASWRGAADAEPPADAGEREGVKYGEPEQADVEGHGFRVGYSPEEVEAHMRVRVSRAELEQALQNSGAEVEFAVPREQVEGALASETAEVEAHTFKYNG